MNIEQANAIPLPEILKQLNARQATNNGIDLMYYSPFRKEKTPSFHVNALKNIWYDFGIGHGGTVIDLVCTYLKNQNEDDTAADALRWINNMTVKPDAIIIPFPQNREQNTSPALSVKKVDALNLRPLLAYLESRGISEGIAKEYLQKALILNNNTGKEFYAVALPNEDGGYELRNRYFKGSTHPKGISFIRHKNFFPDTVHVFEGFMDFLSALMQQKDNDLKGDVIILNSVTCLPKTFPYIMNYTYTTVCSWMDNDTAGKKAAEALKLFAEKNSMKFKPMNKTYLPHKDVNAHHINTLGLRPV